MKQLDFLSVGEVLIDMTPAETAAGERTFLPKVGGAPVNAACAAARLGVSAGFAGRAGMDAFGDQIERVLRQTGLDTSLLQRDADRGTTLAFVHLGEGGERSFSFYRKGLADTHLEATEAALAAVEDARLLHFGSVALAEEPEKSVVLRLVQHARSAGRWVSYDPNLRPNLWADQSVMKDTVLSTLHLADILKLSDDEAELLLGISDPEEAAKQLHEKYGAAVAFVTCGRAGAWGCTEWGTAFAPALAVDSVDTTGAGDCFVGAACYRLLTRSGGLMNISREELEDILRFACAAGSLTTARRGAIDALPTLDEVAASLK